jgi:hypothetical protein
MSCMLQTSSLPRGNSHVASGGYVFPYESACPSDELVLDCQRHVDYSDLSHHTVNVMRAASTFGITRTIQSGQLTTSVISVREEVLRDDGNHLVRVVSSLIVEDPCSTLCINVAID